MAKNVYECDFCGDEFEEWPSQSHKFCGKPCYNKSRRNRLEKECVVCGDSFETVPSDDCDTCSKECGYKVVSEKRKNDERECENPDCSNMFQSGQPDRRFCCLECSYGFRSWDGRDLTELECEQCGDTYSVKSSYSEGSSFCSRECKNEWQKENLTGSDNPRWNSVEKNCKWCDGKYFVRKGRVKESIFCSKECSAKWRSENLRGENHPLYSRKSVECANCGENIETKSCRVGIRKFCNRNCLGEYRDDNWHCENHPNWKPNGGLGKYYGSNWSDKRNKVLERDGFSCVFCGATEKHIGMLPDVHHIIPLRFFDNPSNANYEGNLVCLCKSCHGFFEGSFLSPRLMNLLIG